MSDEQGSKPAAAPARVSHRGLFTVLMTDLVDSTATAARLGDNRWRELLHAYFDRAQAAVAQTGGQEVRTLGDGILAIFRSPAQALACALRVVEDAEAAELITRAGVHAGEIEVLDDDVVGVAVHVAARICAAAGPREVLASATVRELARGAELDFRRVGARALKGVEGRHQLFAVAGRPTSADNGGALPRLLLVDDHPLWRQTMRTVLESSGRAEVVGEASDGEEALGLATELAPDLVLMDIDMPRLDGIAATAGIVGANPNTRVLVLSSTRDERTVLAAVEAGASGYMLKTAGAPELLGAVRRIRDGEVVFPPELAGMVLGAIRGQRPSQAGDALGELTSRETEVLELMAQGLSNGAIASQLQVSPKTVEAHSGAIFSKLGIDGEDQHRRVVAVLAHLGQRRPGR